MTPDLMPRPALRPDEACSHPGCLNHVSHPCEGCGRIAGRYPADAPPAPAAGTPEPPVCTSCGHFSHTTHCVAIRDNGDECACSEFAPAETPPAAEPRESLPTHFPRHITRDGTAIYAPEHAPKPLSWGAAERAGGGTTEYESSESTETLVRRAHEELSRLCAGRGRKTHKGLVGKNWTMCIPRRDDDSDEVFAAVIIRAAELDHALTAERAHRAQAEAERDALVAGIRRVLDCPCLSGASCDELDRLRATLAGGGQE